MKDRVTLFLIPLFMLLLFAIAGCRTETKDTEIATPVPKPESTVAQPTNTPITEVQIPTSETLPPEPTPVEPLVESTVVVTPGADLDNDVDVCGVLLPVVVDEVAPEIVELPTKSVPWEAVPVDAHPALERLLSAPATVGLAAFEIGSEDEGIYINQDVPMPLASVVKIINLVAYAEAVDDGLLDPGSWLTLDELNKYYIPRVDLGAHNQAIEELDIRALIAGDPPATPLEEVPGMMIRFSSNAAADYIHLLLGQELIERTAVELGIESQTAPCPWIGQFLILANHERVESHREIVETYINDPSSYSQDVMSYTTEFANDGTFREEEISWRRRQPSSDVWNLFAENLNAKGSAADYADVLKMAMLNQIGSPYVSFLVRRYFEWPMELQANQELFSSIGYKGGALPGVLTTAYYGQRLEDGKQVVVVIFFRDLPRLSYQRWQDDLPHDALARWLLSDPSAINIMRDLIDP